MRSVVLAGVVNSVFSWGWDLGSKVLFCFEGLRSGVHASFVRGWDRVGGEGRERERERDCLKPQRKKVRLGEGGKERGSALGRKKASICSLLCRMLS